MSAPTRLSRETVVAESTEPGPSRDEQWAWRWFLPVTALLVALTGLQVNQYSPISIFDETAHFGYVVEIGDGRIPYYGTLADDEAREEVTCRLWEERIGFQQFPCARGEGGPELYPASDYPASAAVYTVDHPPPYYVVAAGTVAVLDQVPVLTSDLTIARLSNAFWMLIALVGVWDAMRRLGVGPWSRAVASVLVLASPQVLYFAGIVNPEIALVTAGALTVTALVRHDITRRGSWLVGLAALSAVAVKSNGVVVPLLVGVFLVLRAWQEAVAGTPDGRSWWAWAAWPRVKALLWVGGLSLPAFLAWREFQQARRDVPDGFAFTADRAADAFPVRGLLNTYNVFLLEGGGPNAIGHEVAVLLNSLLAVVVVVCVAGAVVVTGPASREAAIAITGVLGTLVVAALFVVFLYAASGTYVPVIQRYLLGALPFQAVAVGIFLHRTRRPASIAVAVIGAVVIGVYLQALIAFE